MWVTQKFVHTIVIIAVPAFYELRYFFLIQLSYEDKTFNFFFQVIVYSAHFNNDFHLQKFNPATDNSQKESALPKIRWFVFFCWWIMRNILEFDLVFDVV